MSSQLTRFIEAQDATIYTQALSELEDGSKQTHWMWFIFPQLHGLGQSENARLFGLNGAAEALAYLAHPILGERLRACTRAILRHAQTLSAADILGETDARKFQSCMTLFSLVAPGEPLWSDALKAFFAGQADPCTLNLLATPTAS